MRRHADPDVDDVVTTDDAVVSRRPAGVVASRWSVADGLVAIIGAGLALIGLVALVRTGVDDTWFRPVERVLDANHTALLGAGELGAGVLLMLAGAAPSRALAALVGLGMAVGGALAAIETNEVSRELAIEEWWAWTLAGTGALVAVIVLLFARPATSIDRVA
ncbi:MAG: hypothetical protein ACRD2C_21025 [Acidimicrobiales bacterium]